MMLRSGRKAAMTAATVWLTAVALAAGPRSPSYSLEYVSTANSGSAAATSHYEVVSQVQLSGFTGGPTSSANYSVMPVSAATTEDASVSDWTLY